jgi:uncharacterized protein (UPF0333 family)
MWLKLKLTVMLLLLSYIGYLNIENYRMKSEVAQLKEAVAKQIAETNAEAAQNLQAAQVLANQLGEKQLKLQRSIQNGKSSIDRKISTSGDDCGFGSPCWLQLYNDANGGSQVRP